MLSNIGTKDITNSCGCRFIINNVCIEYESRGLLIE